MGANVGIETLKLFENDWLLLSDFIDFFFDTQEGKGTSRTVFQFRMKEDWVVKVDRSKNGFNNVSEWEIWTNVYNNDKKLAGFLAPCHYISGAGKFMIQAKTKPVKVKELPVMIPAFLADTKVQNWGKIGRKVVCHDYANHSFFTGKNTMKLVKAKWWSDGDLNTMKKVQEKSKSIKVG